MYNPNSLDTICASLAYAMGIEAPKEAASPNEDLVAYIDKIFGSEKADRIFMYNPDAIAQWGYENTKSRLVKSGSMRISRSRSVWLYPPSRPFASAPCTRPHVCHLLGSDRAQLEEPQHAGWLRHGPRLSRDRRRIRRARA